MLTLIFALAARLVARVAGAVVARLSHFPAVSLPGTLAGKIFSLPAGSGKMAQQFDVTSKFRSNRENIGTESKIFPAVCRLAGKIALTGATSMPRRRSPADDRQYQCADDHDRRKGRGDDPRGR